MLGYVQCGHIPDDVQIGQQQELAGLSSSNCSGEYNKDPVSLAIAGQCYEKATITLMVDLAGNRPLEAPFKGFLSSITILCCHHKPYCLSLEELNTRVYGANQHVIMQKPL